MSQKEFDEIVLKYCQFPIPRTRYMILEELKKNGFWKKTPARRAVSLLNKKLEPLKEKGLLLEYTENDSRWNEMRVLLKKYCTAHGLTKPRRVQKIYQTNFFYSGREMFLPVLGEHNFVLTALFSRFNRPKNFGMRALNLFLAYDQDPGRMRVKAYNVLPEEDAEVLEKALEASAWIVRDFGLPFKPDVDNALRFLEEVAGHGP